MRERLYRSRDDRMLFGVAGGMADWLDLDPSIVRLVWALLILAGGIGLVLYIVAAIVIPEAPPGYVAPAATAATTGAAGVDAAATQPPRRANRGSRDGSIIFGLVLVLAGGWFLVDRYIDIDASAIIPAVLIVVGIALLLGAARRTRGPNGA